MLIMSLYMYQVTTKLGHRLYYDATIVDYNLFVKFFNIGDVKYPACARLHKQLKLIAVK